MPIGDEIDARLRALENVVRSLEAETERAKVEGQRLSARRIEQEIPLALGVVVVDIYGVLREVKLNREKIRLTNGAGLSKRITEAISAAEQQAADLREQVNR